MNRWTLAATLSSLLALATGGAAWAEQSPAQRAQPHVNAAQEAFNAEDYEEALREFTAARELIEEPTLTYNIALCHERLDHLREAIDEYNRFLREAPDARNADEIRAKIEELHARRVEERDADLDVEAADDAQREDRRGRARAQGRLGVARHELDVWIGTGVTIAPGLRGGGGSAGLNLEFDYHFRLTPTWHIGVVGLYDSFFQGEKVTNGSEQRQYGGAINGRYSLRFLNDRLELRFNASLGYEFTQRHLGSDFHWIFVRIAAGVAYAIWHGFGVHLRLGFRFGGIAGGHDDQSAFGGTFDATAGVFWAF